MRWPEPVGSEDFRHLSTFFMVFSFLKCLFCLLPPHLSYWKSCSWSRSPCSPLSPARITWFPHHFVLWSLTEACFSHSQLCLMVLDKHTNTLVSKNFILFIFGFSQCLTHTENANSGGRGKGNTCRNKTTGETSTCHCSERLVCCSWWGWVPGALCSSLCDCTDVLCCALCYQPISISSLWGLQGQRPWNFMSLFLVPSTVLGTEVVICWLKK